MISDFRAGLTFWMRGWGHIFDNGSLLAAAALPALVAMLFAGGLVWLIFTHLGAWVQALIGSVIGIASGFWYDIAYYPLVVGGGLLVFIACVYVAFILHTLIAIPFYSSMAEKTLVQLGKAKPTTWRDTLRMFKTGLAKALLMLTAGLILFVFSFIPVLNVIAITCALLILAFDCMDYSFECLGMTLRQRTGYLFRERAQWAGMAAGLALTLLIPGLTLLVIPGAVVGCALIVKERK